MIFTATVAVVLGLLEYIIFFRSHDYFFQGDTIWYFYLRHHSLQDFLLGFTKLDAAGWYRPLSATTVQSLFYPLFGLEPDGYRVVHYIVFMMLALAIYALASFITKRRIAACIATFFFAVHTVNGFTTFDLSYTTEIFYAFFYISAVIAYLRRSVALSVVLFMLSLFSKEAAVTLPVMIIALDVILNRRPVLTAIAGARAHLIVLGVYLAFVVGYLGVQRPAFESIISRPGPEVAYRFALDRTIVDNAQLALTWSFNIPRGWQTDARNLRNWMTAFLEGFRVIVVLLGVWLFFQPERRIMLAGLAWFFIAVSPPLPLFEHFLPYYLNLPLAGFSIAIGIMFDAAYRKTPAAAGIAIVILFGILTGVCVYSARNDVRDNRVLGISARLAENSMNDLKAAHPTLRPNTTIYISDAEEPNLSWDTSLGRLFKMSYGDESINTLYWSWGEVLSKGVMERGPVVVMRYHQFHLTDVTADFLARSVPPVPYRPPGAERLDVTPPEARPGEKYRMSVSGLANADILVHYTREGGPVQEFAVRLDSDHQITLDVSEKTEKGLHRFVGFRMPGGGDWVQASASILIK
jgi:xanthosine utilization system XapX-like protein